MRKKIIHYAKEFLLFVIILTIAMNIMSLYKSTSLNNTYIDLNATKLLNNQLYTHNKDKPILVHIWATWCPTCKLESENINILAKHYEVITIAVNSGSDNDIKDYMLENQLNYKVINDRSGYLAKQFNISVYPSTFIYDKDRALVFSEVGYTSTIGLFLRMFWSSI